MPKTKKGKKSSKKIHRVKGRGSGNIDIRMNIGTGTKEKERDTYGFTARERRLARRLGVHPSMLHGLPFNYANQRRNMLGGATSSGMGLSGYTQVPKSVNKTEAFGATGFTPLDVQEIKSRLAAKSPPVRPEPPISGAPSKARRTLIYPVPLSAATIEAQQSRIVPSPGLSPIPEVTSRISSVSSASLPDSGTSLRDAVNGSRSSGNIPASAPISGAALQSPPTFVLAERHAESLRRRHEAGINVRRHIAQRQSRESLRREQERLGSHRRVSMSDAPETGDLEREEHGNLFSPPDNRGVSARTSSSLEGSEGTEANIMGMMGEGFTNMAEAIARRAESLEGLGVDYNLPGVMRGGASAAEE